MDLPVLDFAETMAGLPPQQPEEGLDKAIRKALADRYDVVIVLDDDPTGTQTVYNVPVITEMTSVAFETELEKDTKLFFALTNSRMYPAREVVEGSAILGISIREACYKMGKQSLVIIRGDSTLRGHFDYEDRYLANGLGIDNLHPFFIPAFFEGGRYTINDVHYVKEGIQLIPAAQTPFGKDSSFGYHNSNLKAWVEEKAFRGNLPVEPSISVSIKELRATSPTLLKEKIEGKQDNQTCIINAADYTDLKRAALAILRFAESPQLRTSASFIKALLGQPDRPLLTFPKQANLGGLIVVGSHVPKTTAQLKHLQGNHELEEFEVDVRSLLAQQPSIAPAALAQKISTANTAGKNVLLYTSREVITTEGADANLDIAATVSAYLEAVVAALPSAPAFLLTKGGITSSRIATESLGVKRAMAIGQVQPGVPTWELGPESKFPGLPFIIFPGNVGGEDSLSRILQNTFI